ncbi:putative T7SS-secreted protein [Streptomyces sp. NPDC059709]|uniref:putative T7SS-secreted protein n=1 Tax=Streptomyces sp. NPDC059709 TaxID=3346917 RepID=UPI0036903038
MTVPAGQDTYGAALDPQSRADLGKPQGLKSAPPVPNPDYPHLGFNPVPGDTETVRGLEKKLSGCATVLQEAYDLVTKLLDGSYWKGDAAVAFREQLDGGPLPLNLKNAAHSVRKAARQLDRWEGELDDFQRRARKLEGDAKDAQAVVDRAQGRVKRAGADADLKKDGPTVTPRRRPLLGRTVTSTTLRPS